MIAKTEFYFKKINSLTPKMINSKKIYTFSQIKKSFCNSKLPKS